MFKVYKRMLFLGIFPYYKKMSNSDILDIKMSFSWKSSTFVLNSLLSVKEHITWLCNQLSNKYDENTMLHNRIKFINIERNEQVHKINILKCKIDKTKIYLDKANIIIDKATSQGFKCD